MLPEHIITLIASVSGLCLLLCAMELGYDAYLKVREFFFNSNITLSTTIGKVRNMSLSVRESVSE